MMKKLTIAMMFMSALIFSIPSYARSYVNTYWTIEANYNARNCNIASPINTGQTIVVVANSRGVHLVIHDPYFNTVADGGYSFSFYFDNMPDLQGDTRIDGDALIIPNLNVNAVNSLMVANYVGVRSGDYNKTYTLYGSDEAIRAVLQCAVNNGFR